ncbi:hypothetical protein PIB30_058046 [Stylosanthes scabra]|uniref:Uncharacterized protein n=1 Tax=Stylosanthes scabra TaxID=79078 RepID=A0ABU6WN53_9FABA|nr:hypothetical protein [Stylosanthes scabra]
MTFQKSGCYRNNGYDGGSREAMMHAGKGKSVVDNSFADPLVHSAHLSELMNTSIGEAHNTLLVDPVFGDAQLNFRENQVCGMDRDWERTRVVSAETDLISSDFCTYPPEFGPCTNSNHVHRLEQHNNELKLGGCVPDAESEKRNPTDLPLENKGMGEEEEREEAISAKELYELGGISFKARNEDDLLVRLAGRNVQN